MTQRYLWGAMVLVAAMLIGVPAIWAGDLASIELQAAGQQCEATPMLVAAADGESQPGGEGAVGSGDVQERAVPRLTPGMPGMAPMVPRREFEQAIVEGNRITAKPGFTITVLPNGTGVLARKKNDPLGTGVKCVCTGKAASGSCKLVVTGGSTGNCVSDTCKNGFCGVELGGTKVFAQ